MNTTRMGAAGYLLGACLLTACASVAALRPQAQIEDLAALEAASAAFPRLTVRVPTNVADGHPTNLCIEEVGSGQGSHVVVMIHGVLSDRRIWRFLPGELAAASDLWLMDLPGCGDSDAPDVSDDVNPYCPTELARAALTALRARLAARAVPPRVTLVGHSLGGAVVLRMLGSPELRDEFDDVRCMVDSAVLFSPLDIAVEKPDPAFEEITALSAFEVQVAGVVGLLSRNVLRSTRDSMCDPENCPREESQRMEEILSDPGTLRSAQAMLRSAVPHGDDRRPDWPRIEALVADYGRVDVPCMIVWGARDETLPLSMGYKLQAQLPRAWLVVVPRAMHSIPVEHPRLTARLIRSFCESEGAGLAAVSYLSGASDCVAADVASGGSAMIDP